MLDFSFFYNRDSKDIKGTFKLNQKLKMQLQKTKTKK